MANQQFHLFELKAGLCRQSVVRRLLRFWKARNLKKGRGLSGFICVQRLNTFRNILKQGRLYDLSGFDVTKSNQRFLLSDSHVSIRFTDQTKFHELPENRALIPMELFRFRDYDHSMLLANTNTDLHGRQTFIFDNLAMQLLDKLVIHGVEPRVISATNINPKLVGGMHVPD
ncbi:hypothetical protein F2Q70_00040347 [Brassica cretica]|uniref:DUF223 domain-containing protein n=1 Tax=Brassica cretica TaxID=69181 RepID=A0A8S9KBS6_BRACR|nr:hypothetical protein F2Q70_00040347 [Brassica cretica]